ncbi:MFS transporter [Nocardia wallacei]|uniref:MFS transporter n=1 Tax=Nocardia wallacei TaxID=480035 RepID=UPI002453CEA6|nr:MFS transporter [Nocardia wallacei]
MTLIEKTARTTIPESGRARPARRGLVLGLVCAAQSMVSVDIAIVNVALPSIQRDLHVGNGGAQWVVVAYGLLLGGFLLVGGRLTDLVGRRRMLLAGLTLFTAASLLAGLSQSLGLLVAARGLQGLGGALVVPAALSLLAVTFREGRERNRALGVFGAVGGAAGTLGVVAGGLIAGGPGWRWAFFINVPAGLALLAIVAVYLVADRSRDRSGRLDLAGAGTVTSGLLLFVYALHHAATHGWTAMSTLAWGGAAAVALAAFVVIETRAATPLVPAAAVRNRTLLGANLTALFGFGAFFSFIFLGSLLMQQEFGYSPVRTGLAWLATTTTVFVTSTVAGRLAAAVSVRRMLITGLALIAVGMLWLTQISADAGYLAGLLTPFLLAGLGFGLCVPSLQIGALAGVTEAETGLAAGLIETMREIGGAAGVAAVSTVLVAGTGLGGFHAAFAMTAVLSVAGILTAATVFGRESAVR